MFIFVGCTIFLTFLFRSIGADVVGFDRAIANTSVWLSAAAYCETDTLLTHNFSGYSTGFTTRYVIEAPEKDVQGFVGYMTSQSAIYVVYRGSTSIEDWIGNIDVKLTDYPLCEDCKVHQGFYEAQQSVSGLILQYVKALRLEFPSYTIIITGHSLGAAMATLTANDLKANGLEAIRMFNFGSPRVGNEDFAAWTSEYIPDHNRVTHHRDMVVHLPNHHRFAHITNEWYEDENHEIHACEGAADTSCSYQFFFTNVRDHMEYLTLHVGCDAVTNITSITAALV